MSGHQFGAELEYTNNMRLLLMSNDGTDESNYLATYELTPRG